MLLRRITQHVKDQNWFAVFLDFFIVVAGILIAFQITNWSAERALRKSERDFLERLHGDIVELQERRSQYDIDRPILMNTHAMILEFLYGQRADLTEAEALHVEFTPSIKNIKGFDTSLVCNSIDWSDALTVPPATLPTAQELVSAGRISDIESPDVKAALQTYLQQADRAEIYTNAIAEKALSLPAEFPDLFDIKTHDWAYGDIYGESFLKFQCDYDAMKQSPKFLNAFAINANIFTNYTNRSVKPVSEKLALLHDAIDQELDITHIIDQETP